MCGIKQRLRILLAFVLTLPLTVATCQAGNLAGYLLDPMGVGLYEMAVNCNDTGNTTWGGIYWTPPSGWFSFYNTPGTVHNVIADDHLAWGTTHGLALADNVYTHKIFARATVFQYAPSWDTTWHKGVAQTFVADGTCILKVTIRIASSTANFNISVHKDGPTGPQIGPTRTVSAGFGGAATAVWQPGEVPTTPGSTYCVKVMRTDGQAFSLYLVEPLVDNGDACPGGCLWWFDGSSWVPDWNWDTGIIVVSDGYGLLCNLNAGKWGRWGTNVPGASTFGQTFVARGSGLVSASFTVDTSGNYVVSVYNYDGAIGSQIGTSKILSAGANTESIGVVWGPGEFPPLVQGRTYYIEIKRQGGGVFGSYRTNGDVYTGGTLFVNRIAQPSYDLATTIYVESAPGEAGKRQIRIEGGGPRLIGQSTDSLTIYWATDVAADTRVEYSSGRPPYTMTYYSPVMTTAHSVTLTGLTPNTIYHYRVSSGRSGYYAAVSRDFVAATAPVGNLLANPGFETGSLSPWFAWSGNVQIHSGEWFWNMPPRSGTYAAQLAQNGGPYSTTGIYQRVQVTPGKWYRVTGWFSLFPTEKIGGTDYLKYDVWDQSFARLMQARIGLDPSGGTNASSPSVVWSRNAYSFPNPNVYQGNTAANFHYVCLSVTAKATSNYMTLFTAVDAGDLLSWDCWSMDDFALTEIPSVSILSAKLSSDGKEVLISDVVVTATPSQVGAYYVEDANRITGIRVESADTAFVGDIVTVIGNVSTNENGERVIKNASILSAVHGAALGPVGLRCSFMGGSDQFGASGIGQQGVIGGMGPNNIGLLVRVWGELRAVQTQTGVVWYVNDGSLPDPGLKVDFGSINPPGDGVYAVITGISTCEVADSGLISVLRARSEADILYRMGDNLLVNPGFETGSLANWTSYGAIDGPQSGTWFGGISAHSGNWFIGS
ncbi:MAG: hypothetical protein ACUVRS_12190, partial [Armatimonadota bacterium]